MLLGKGACAAGRPDSSLSAPPPRLRPPLPPRRVCTTAETRRANAASPGLGGGGVEIKQDDDLSFPSPAFPSKNAFKNHKRISDPASHPTSGSEFKCPVSNFRCEFHIEYYPFHLQLNLPPAPAPAWLLHSLLTTTAETPAKFAVFHSSRNCLFDLFLCTSLGT